jgi:CRP-like cAMP-binding protein
MPTWRRLSGAGLTTASKSGGDERDGNRARRSMPGPIASAEELRRAEAEAEPLFFLAPHSLERKYMVDAGLFARNTILSSLGPQTVDELLGEVELVNLHTHQTLHEPNVPLASVYFPLDCVVSVVTSMRDGTAIEVGSIGREGTTGVFATIGLTIPNSTFCQVDGRSLVMSIARFQNLLAEVETFSRAVQSYVQGYINVLAQLVACNRLHDLDQRCARWLLMTYDRVGKRSFPLTQEFLAMMLGVRRSGVTLAASGFQEAGFIKYSRGVITILDRTSLESEACECYDVGRAWLVFPPPPPE